MSANQRKHLNAYDRALRNIELAGAAMAILEGVNSSEATRAITILGRGQQRQLKLLDGAAAKLGAPYPGGKS